jgi:hypothetical protein
MTFRSFILASVLSITCTSARADSVWDWIWSSPRYDADTKTAWWTAQGTVPVAINGQQFELRLVRGGSQFEISGTIKGYRVIAKGVNLETDNDSVSFTGNIVTKDKNVRIEMTSLDGDFMGLKTTSQSN